MGLKDIFKRRKAEEPQKPATPSLYQMLGSAEGFGSLRPGAQYINPAISPRPELSEALPSESAVMTGSEEEAYSLGQRMGAEGLINAKGGSYGIGDGGTQGGMPEEGAAITKEHVKKAWEDLQRYREGKLRAEERIKLSQKWWRLCNWDIIQIEREVQNGQQARSNTPWLFHSIARKHAELMDSYPEALILPRNADDKHEARILSSVIPVILQRNKFKTTYSDCKYQKILEGTEIYGVFWDGTLLNGLGDVSIKKVNALNMFWEPGIENIEDSKQVFYCYLMDNDELLAEYPQLEGKVGRDASMLPDYENDDNIRKDNKSIVVDWYYKRRVNGKTIIHLCTFSCGEILSSTENAGMMEGLYEDGEYPFAVGQMYKVANNLLGYGQVDFHKDTQIDIDTMNNAMVLNAVVAAVPRNFVKTDGGINEQEYADLSKHFVHVNGSIDERAIRPIEAQAMPAHCMNMLQHKIDEMKYTTGDTDVSNGSVPAGVTAASAIAALQEQHGLTTKDIIMGDHETYSIVVAKVMSRVRQGYNIERSFRIAGTDGTEDEYIMFSNAGMVPQQQMVGMGLHEGEMRLPEWDIEVRIQRENAYTRMSNNDLAIQLFQLGFMNPQNVTMAITALSMMDFKGREELMQKLKKNADLLQAFVEVSQIALTLAQQYNPEMADRLAGIIQQITGNQTGMAMPQGGGGKINAKTPEGNATGNEDEKGRNPIADRARERAENATQLN